MIGRTRSRDQSGGSRDPESWPETGGRGGNQVLRVCQHALFLERYVSYLGGVLNGL